MSSVRRRLALLLGGALAMMAFAAPTASATNPDFPHADYKAEHWHSVSPEYINSSQGTCFLWYAEPGESCPFSLEPHNWFLKIGGTYWACELKMSGHFTADGTFTVTKATTGSPSGYQTVCNYFKPANLPWTGTVCDYATGGQYGTHEFWLRLDPEFSWQYGYIEGETFGKFKGTGQGGGIMATGVDFDHATFGDGGEWGYEHDGEFRLPGKEPRLEMNAFVGEECSWPELS